MESAELPTKVLAIIFKWMFHFASHERIRILLENAQTGLRAEIDSLASVDGAGVIRRVVELASAGGFTFG